MGNDGRRICVTGGRDFSDKELVCEVFARISLSQEDILVEGEARGADRLCAEVAREMGACVEPHHAKWQLYGNVAGFIRNVEMLESGIDLLIAFPGGRGTAHCVSKARERGIPILHAIMIAGQTKSVSANQAPREVTGADVLGKDLQEDDGMVDLVTDKADDDPQARLF